MATLKSIRVRIGSVKSTRKITKAMKMVAAARLRKAEDAARALRPYASRTREIISSLAARTDRTDFPLLAEREETRNVLLVVLTSDKGLCGAFNANVNRAAERFVKERGAGSGVTSVTDETIASIKTSIVGRKGKTFFTQREIPIERYYEDVLGDLHIEKAELIGQDLIQDFTRQDLDAVYLVYNEYKSAMLQNVVVEPLLPIIPDVIEESENPVDYLYEPSREAVLDEVLPLYVNVQVFRALLESMASEMGARMTAMESATKNASELIDKLTLQYNKLRQAAITTELMEIISGAEAQGG
jgi:F-type H+-transporting ATPase subunit gamma